MFATSFDGAAASRQGDKREAEEEAVGAKEVACLYL